jgi:uncharacterized protein DUF4126
LFLGIAARFDLIHLRPGAGWIATDHALLALGIATALEIAADKIPVLDHALDAVAIRHLRESRTAARCPPLRASDILAA